MSNVDAFSRFKDNCCSSMFNFNETDSLYLQLKENIVLFYLYVKVHSLLFVITTLTQLSSLEIKPSTWNLKTLASEAIAASCVFLAPDESSDFIICQSQALVPYM